MQHSRRWEKCVKVSIGIPELKGSHDRHLLMCKNFSKYSKQRRSESDLYSSGSGKNNVTGSWKCSNELSGSIRYGKFYEQLRYYQHLKKSFSLWEMVTWHNSLKFLMSSNLCFVVFTVSPALKERQWRIWGENM